jgi:hypothetical protein
MFLNISYKFFLFSLSFAHFFLLSCRRKLEETFKEENLSARQRNRRKRQAKLEGRLGNEDGRNAGLDLKTEANSAVSESKPDIILFASQVPGPGGWEVCQFSLKSRNFCSLNCSNLNPSS